MPKIKSNSGAKKRFKVSANGIIMHARANKNHGMIKWSAKRNLQLRSNRTINSHNDRKVRKSLLPSLGNCTRSCCGLS